MSSSRQHPDTLILVCPVCGSDSGEPLGVTGHFANDSDSTVIIRCGDCRAVYMAPERSDLSGPSRALPADALTKSRMRRWSRGLGSTPSVLKMDGAAMEEVRKECSTAGEGFESRGYDLIVLPLMLETERELHTVLDCVRSLLTEDGRAIAIIENTDSACFHVFGARHWSGYRFPDTLQHFNSRAISRLCEDVGLRVTELYTLPSVDSWLDSITNWLIDWGVNERLRRLVAGNWPGPRVLAYVLDALCTAAGRGSLLVAVLHAR